MYKVFLTFRPAVLLLLTLSLTGCLGGTIAQQVLRSVATSVADKAIGNAIEKREAEARNRPSELGAFVANSGFKEIQPTVEPLQASNEPSQNSQYNPQILADETQPNDAIVEVKIVPLVQIEILNLLVGDEKKAVFERARLMGALNLPKQREWPVWHVATGLIEDSPSNSKQPITFLIPPHIGKLPSGTIAVVEIASAGDLNMLRYQVNERQPNKIKASTAKIVQAQSSQ